MKNMILIFIALLPVLLLLFYIYKRDKYQPEPVKQILKAFFYGTGSVVIALLLAGPLSIYTLDFMPILEKFREAFLEAAIPEEVAKFVLLWLFLKKNRYFDEKVDGIVYAVCVSLGFAAVENVSYLFHNYEDWLYVGFIRALFAVPGHFGFGVLMGYYYSLVSFSSLPSFKNRILILLAPILTHGVYDFILFVIEDAHPIFILVLFIYFLVLCFRLHVLCRKKINHLLQLDEETFVKTFEEKRGDGLQL